MAYFSASKASLADSTLLLPSVSIGNCAQLAYDLIINNFPFKLVGYIEDSNIFPIVGHSENETSLHVAIEIYHWEEKNLTLLQQRSPIIKSRRKQFVENLIKWIHEFKFKEVILLTSSDASKRMDSQILNQNLRYVKNSFFERNLDHMNWAPLENHVPSEELEDPSELNISFAGISKYFFKRCEEEKISLLLIIYFTSEGDNVQASINLANQVNHFFQLVQDNSIFSWRPPSSWKFLLSSNVDSALYH